MKNLTATITMIFTMCCFISFSVFAQDSDSDFWDDLVDNCKTTKNSNQRDSDADGHGNVCDNCPLHDNPTQADGNGNDLGDACDPPPPPLGSISGTDLEAPHACIISAFANPANFNQVKAGTAIFDTGSDVILLGGPTAQNLDDLTPPSNFFNPGSSQTVSNLALNCRNMGQQTGSYTKGWPTLAPEAEAQNVWVRVTPVTDDKPILVGAPFANQVYAYIDHTQVTSIPDGSGGLQTCPAVSFWFDTAGTPVPPQASPLDPPPSPLFCAALKRFGAPPSPGDMNHPTKGQRYYIRAMRFQNGSNTVASPAAGPISTPSRFLYDTGNKTTQISESMAGAGGLGIDTGVCSGANCIRHKIDGVWRNCYRIDKVEIGGNDSSLQYIIITPWVCVVPDGSNALGADADANIGMNYFEPTQQLFDGINDKLCFFAGVPASGPNGSDVPQAPRNLRIEGE